MIPFDTKIDADELHASFCNGVLKVELPKSDKAKDNSRRIEIKPD